MESAILGSFLGGWQRAVPVCVAGRLPVDDIAELVRRKSLACWPTNDTVILWIYVDEGSLRATAEVYAETNLQQPLNGGLHTADRSFPASFFSALDLIDYAT
jgi:hypothetical protein